MAPKILFISHEASRTGAPLLLLHVLRWLKENSDLSFEIVLGGPGPLAEEFAAIGPITTLRDDRPTPPALPVRLLRRLGAGRGPTDAVDARLLPIRRRIEAGEFALIYSNTITNGRILSALAPAPCPILCHAHELEHTIRSWYNQEDIEETKRLADHYIAGSAAVQRNLVAHHGIPQDRIDVVYEVVPAPDYSEDAPGAMRVQARERLGIPQDAFVVGGCGTLCWRKGPDLFLQVALSVRRRAPDRPVRLVWIGGDLQGAPIAELRYDVELAGLADTVLLPGEQANIADYFPAFDVFALTSREDPFPLVCLNAGAMAIPSLCFEGAGGIGDFVEDDCGIQVPYLDVDAMAEGICRLMDAPELRERMGRQARRKVRERHDVSVGAPRVLEVIRRLS